MKGRPNNRLKEFMDDTRKRMKEAADKAKANPIPKKKAKPVESVAPKRRIRRRNCGDVHPNEGCDCLACEKAKEQQNLEREERKRKEELRKKNKQNKAKPAKPSLGEGKPLDVGRPKPPDLQTHNKEVIKHVGKSLGVPKRVLTDSKGYSVPHGLVPAPNTIRLTKEEYGDVINPACPYCGMKKKDSGGRIIQLVDKFFQCTICHQQFKVKGTKDV